MVALHPEFYDFELQKHTSDEVGKLSEAFNHMVGGLREKELIRNLFGKYVHPSIVSDIMSNPENLERSGTRKVQTLLFSDIAGFTTITEGMNAEALVSAVVICVVVTVFFTRVMRVPLPTGPFFGPWF